MKITQISFNVVWHFPPIFVLYKFNCLVTLFDQKHKVFKNSPTWIIFGIFNELLFPQNVNVTQSLAMLNETFSVIFKHRDLIGILFICWVYVEIFEFSRQKLSRDIRNWSNFVISPRPGKNGLSWWRYFYDIVLNSR